MRIQEFRLAKRPKSLDYVNDREIAARDELSCDFPIRGPREIYFLRQLRVGGNELLQPLTRTTALETSDVAATSDGRTSITLARGAVVLPERSARLRSGCATGAS